jgi:hypothetical protein
MDIGKLWSDLVALMPPGWPGAIEAFIANPWTRAAGLLLLVYFTIRVIASVYSGAKNRAEMGPVAIRPHVSGRFDRKTVRVPHKLIEMGLDGVHANCKVFYAYTDANGKRRQHLVHEIKSAAISVSPTNIPQPKKEIIFGQEVPPVPRENVCFPLDLEEPEEVVPPPDEDAQAYATRHKIIEKWREDDDAVTISMHADVKELVGEGKVEFIQDRIADIEKSKKGWWSRRTRYKRLWKNRPNVVGSYYVQFEFSHSPFFVLTRHPDRDLKMTAWLTVLTSVFALIMDAWPKLPSAGGVDRAFNMPDVQSVDTTRPAPRIPVVIPPS